MDKINYSQEVADTSERWRGLPYNWSIADDTVDFGAMIIINNTISYYIFHRNRSGNIKYKYYSAYIRWPYIIEGFTLGVFAAILAGVLVVGGYDLLLNRSAQLSNNYSILGLFQLLPIESMIYDIGLIFILVGSGVGVIASFFSTRKYLNV